MIDPYTQGSIDTAESILRWARQMPDGKLTVLQLERALMIIGAAGRFTK